MTLTLAVLLACLACFALKLAGYVLPESIVAGPRTARITTLLPVALLAALVTVQTVTDSGRLVLDARIAAVALALILLWRKANFLVVVAAATVAAAALRAAGWG